MEGETSRKKRSWSKDDFTDLIFSWSLEDIFNENLYKHQVELIPESFQSVEHYLGSYVFPLLEETRARLASIMETINRAPFAEVVTVNESKPHGTLVYDVHVDSWRNTLIDRGRERYRILPGDVLILSDSKPESVSDLQRMKWAWNFAAVTGVKDDEIEDGSTLTTFKVKSSSQVDIKDGEQKPLYVVFLTNITTNRRIWNSLHRFNNLKIIQNVLCTNALAEEYCDFCLAHCDIKLDEKIRSSLESELNTSQSKAIMTSFLRMTCDYTSHVELIWGPPGTGKTRTISMMLLALLRMNYRTLSCAPTNVAVTEVASRVVKLAKESFSAESAIGHLLSPLGDILLFGNKDRLKVGSDIEEIYLEYRVERLLECFVPLTGWRHCIDSMVDLLEDCVCNYHIYVENESIKLKEHKDDPDEVPHDKPKSFLEFTRDRFKAIFPGLRKCMILLCTHVPTSFILVQNFENMAHLIRLLDRVEIFLFQETLTSDELEGFFLHQGEGTTEGSSKVVECTSSFQCVRSQCLSTLKTLKKSLGKLSFPNVVDKTNKNPIVNFCYQMAILVFCSASSSNKLHSVDMEPLNLLVIDEAAQLKECESIIPLQLQGLRHAILVGDECQLPATINSKVSEEAGFGRSLFERLSSLGHSKHLLNVQYRMHPSISSFPNSNFYLNKILDAPNVKSKGYGRRYLPGRMYGPYSFINVSGGREERDDDEYSLRNMVEVAVVLKIVQKLYKAWNNSGKLFSIGVISPYAAQVAVIQNKLHQKYENLDKFMVKVKSVDGFQGGEEDIIIISTVRANNGGSIGFLSSPQRTNVALTRARHCLWILGNERTLSKSQSIWKAIIDDAKDRQCFFNADEDNDMSKTILDVKKELEQFDDLLNPDSILFKQEKWKVLFSDIFRKSFAKLKSIHMKKSVINLLLKLASGWRPKRKSVDSVCESSSQIVKQFKVEGFYVVCSIDIVKESMYKQIMKAWDILSLEGVPKLFKRLDSIFYMYTDDFINRCKEKCLEGELEVPKSWPISSPIVRYKNLSGNNLLSNSNDTLEGRSYVENSRVSESLLLMKFYSFSTGVVNHLLSDQGGEELDLPFEVTDEELEIIQFSRSSFILGRSGTGKTTVLTMKLFQKEQIYHLALAGFTTAESSKIPSIGKRMEFDNTRGGTEETVLRQLFVTVSPKLCYAVKQHVSRLKSFACGGKFVPETSSFDVDDIDDVEHFRDIPDSFLCIPAKKYPLVITFHKFLMMLDGTLGDSYFERFPEIRDRLEDNNTNSRSVALQTFLRMKEVNYDRFCSFYWPHFNALLLKNQDPSRVFTEIISHIKGGFQTGENHDARLGRQEYVSMFERRTSTLTSEQRKGIYSIFQDYEKMKMERGEFDLADLVMNLHLRLKNKILEGDKMDFVYIDEVQDLTMRQIALFKYICKNVDEGFVFCGDTAQTIARGIDFRFEDIRSLFYNEFIMGSKCELSSARKEKGLLSEMFNLHQNFRTHAGVLRLAQSVIDLLYHFFCQSIDFLKPETSLIYGESPVLLEPDTGSNENAIVTIFGNSVTAGGKIVGFGAEQVILVRDDSARRQISNYVGNQALVLTIVECKGLEFQDVLLYNFFGSSPLRNQWRVVYEFMKEKDLLDSCLTQCPSFSNARHSILCSELKQLYVAITRTRQRLWICENMEEFSKPMFDYWKKLCVVQVKKVDDSLPQAMQMASSPEDWKSRGIKLYLEKNYEMATMCFERAGDTNWEKRAKAASLRATSDRLRGSNPKEAFAILREAAEIFDSIGRAESAAKCFCDLGDYERAGKIYLEKCGESGLKKAGECFTLAKCYERAAEVFARGNYFSECLSVCSKGKHFDLGLRFIESWKQCSTRDSGMTRRGKDIDQIEHNFLESCALTYYEVKDNKSMMKYVRAFLSMECKRNFLKSLDCLDELLLLEEESGNFKEAADIAKQKGDLPLEADMLGKAGLFKDASLLLIWYALSNSLWVPGSKGWPLKTFTQKEKILRKATLFAKQVSDEFYELVCTEVKLLSQEYLDLRELHRYLSCSQQYQTIRIELLSVRKILDAHGHSKIAKYEWEDELLVDQRKHSEYMISENKVSVVTLMYFWNLWKENMLNLLQYLENMETQNVSKHTGVGDFCLNYFGVRRQFKNVNVTHVLLNPDAEWVKKTDFRPIQHGKSLASIDARQFSSAARTHFRTEIISVGLKVLGILEALHDLSITNSLSLFCQSMCLVDIHQVTKFLSESFQCNDSAKGKLQNFLQLSTKYFENVFPLDCTQSLAENMISLRETEVSRNLLEEVIVEILKVKGELTHGQIGRVMMIWFGYGNPSNELYKKIAKRFHENLSWKAFIEVLVRVAPSASLKESPSMWSVNRFTDSALMQVSQSSDSRNDILESGWLNSSASSVSSEAPKKVSVTEMFHEALRDTYGMNWRVKDYISPNCFLYLVDRLLIFVCQSKDFFFTAKYSFVEYLVYLRSDSYPSSSSVSDRQLSPNIAFDSVLEMVQQFLYGNQETAEWIAQSNIPLDYYYPLLVLRLVAVMCLLCLNSGKHGDVLSNLLRQSHIRSQLPRQFVDAFQRGRKRSYVTVNLNEIAEAFKNIGNPIAIVSLRENPPRILCPDAIFIDMRVTSQKDDIMGILFPKTRIRQCAVATDEASVPNLYRGLASNSDNESKFVMLHSAISTVPGHYMNPKNENNGNLQFKWALFEEISDLLKVAENRKDGDLTGISSCLLKIKGELEESVNFLAAGLNVKKLHPDEHETSNTLQEVKKLSSLLDVSDTLVAESLQSIKEQLKIVQSRRPMLEDFLNQMIVLRDNEDAGDKGKDFPSTAAAGSQSKEHSNSATSGNQGKGNNKKKNKKGKVVEESKEQRACRIYM